MQKLALAIAITAQAFKDKLDKGGQPYILHCLYVMDIDADECTKCAAVMHDLVEDTDDKSEINYTLGSLAEMGFSDKTIRLLQLVTHEKDVPYMDYIKGLSISEDAVKIKKKDLRHNSDISRLKDLSKKSLDRLEIYHRAYTYLKHI